MGSINILMPDLQKFQTKPYYSQKLEEGQPTTIFPPQFIRHKFNTSSNIDLIIK